MKLAPLSKSVRVVGSMAMLSIVVATTLQQPVHAQSKGNKVPTTADGSCAPLPEGTFYQEWKGITFSPKQKAAYRESIVKLEKIYKFIADTTKQVDDPRLVDLYFNKGVGSNKETEITAMRDALLIGDKLPGDQVVKLVNKKHGKYVKAVVGQYVVYSSEQITAGQQAGLDFEAEMMSAFTPEQQKKYATNLAIQRRIQACSDPIPFAKIISPLPL